MNFSEALENLKKGKLIRRKVWDRKYHLRINNFDNTIIDTYCVKYSFVTSDILAEDWELYLEYLEPGDICKLENGPICIILEDDYCTNVYYMLSEDGRIIRECCNHVEPIKVGVSDIAKQKYNELIDLLKNTSNRLKNKKL